MNDDFPDYHDNDILTEEAPATAPDAPAPPPREERINQPVTTQLVSNSDLLSVTRQNKAIVAERINDAGKAVRQLEIDTDLAREDFNKWQMELGRLNQIEAVLTGTAVVINPRVHSLLKEAEAKDREPHLEIQRPDPKARGCKASKATTVPSKHGSVADAVLAAVKAGNKLKADIEAAVGKTHDLGPQTISGALAALKKRGALKIKGRNWSLVR